MPKSSPHQLRCALVWERTLCEEHVFRPGQKVTAGDSWRNTFSLRADELGRSFTLFRAGRGGAELRLREGMRGRVTTQGRTWEVAELLAGLGGPGDLQDGSLRVGLSEGDRGVLVFGRAGLAFDFTAAAAAPPPPSLADVLALDRVVARIFGLAMAFLLLVVFASRLFGAPSTDFTVEQLPERFVSFVIEDPNAIQELKRDAQKLREEERRRREDEERRRKEKPEARPEPRPEARPERAPEEVDEARRKLHDRVATKGLVAAMSEARRSNRSLSNLLDESGLNRSLASAMRDLERGRARVLGSVGEEGLASPLQHARTSTEAVGQGERVDGPRVGQAGREAGSASRLAGRAEARVELAMPAEAAQVTGGSLSRKQIADVVMRNKGSIRYCYESQLMRFPTLRGKVLVDFIIEADGSVKTVNIPENGLSNRTAGQQVASCLVRFIRRWRFPQPQGGKVRVVYPFSFGRSQ